MGWQLKQWPSVVTDFLSEVGTAVELRIMRDLRRMASQGHQFRGDTRPLGNGLFELRVQSKKRAFRLLYVHHDNTAVFLHCFEKKSQKTPKPVLDLARQRHAQLLQQEAALGNVAIH
jgi:phage-related protein